MDEAREVATLVVPDPPALSPTATGAETQAQPYRLIVPAVATEPLIMERPDGAQFHWTPTELCYGDQSGLLDFILGSAPSSLNTKGREARYKGTYPNCEEVHIALPEGRKYWFVLNEPLPRGPAEYLTGTIEFGVSGMVGGIPLPPGRHETMESMGFYFPRPVARDLMGNEVQGVYEVVDSDVGQQLFIWFPYAWLIAEDRHFPVAIDPTVTTSTSNMATAESNQPKEATFSNGVRLVAFRVGTGFACRCSSDGGATWLIPTAGETFGGSGGTGTNCAIDIVNDRIHVAVERGNQIDYLMGIPTSSANTGYTWSSPKFIPGAGAGGYFQVSRYPCVAAYPVGSDFRVLVSHSNTSEDASGNPDGDIVVSVLDVTASGVATIRTQTRVWDVSASHYPNWIGFLPSGEPVVVFTSGTRVYARHGVTSGSTYSWNALETVDSANSAASRVLAAACDSQGHVVVAYRRSSDNKLVVKRRSATGTWSELTGIPTITSPSSVFVVCNGEDVFVAYTLSGLKLVKWTAATGTWGSITTLDSDTTAAWVTGGRAVVNSKAIFLYTTGSASPYTVKSHTLSVNAPPFAATVTTGSAAFDAATGTDITITHSDPDGDPMGAWALKRVTGTTTDYWNNTTKAWQSTEFYNSGSGTSVTIPAADNAGKWTTGNVYQLYASTRDSLGQTGPYGDATVVNVGAKPNPSFINPPVVANSGETPINWGVDVPFSAFQVRHLNALGQEVVNTGKVASTSTTAYMVPTPDNNSTYTTKLTVWDQTAGGGVASDEISVTYTTNFTEPNAVRNLTAVADASLAAVKLRWERDYIDTRTNELTANQSLLKSGWTENAATGVVWSFDAINGGVTATAASTITADDYIEVSWPTNKFLGQNVVFSVSVEVLSGAITSGKVLLQTWVDGGSGYVSASTPITGSGRFAHTRQIPASLANTTRTRITFVSGQAPVTLKFTFAQVEQGASASPWILGGTSQDMGTQPSIWSGQYEVHRDGTRIAIVSNPASGMVEYTDYAVASGRTYTYSVRATGSNGTYSPVVTASGGVTISSGLWLHAALDPANTVHFFNYREVTATDTRRHQAGEFMFAGRSAPVVQFDPTMTERSLRLRIALPDELTDRASLEALFARRTTLCLRDHRGRLLYGTITELPIEDLLRFGWATIDFRIVDFREGV